MRRGFIGIGVAAVLALGYPGPADAAAGWTIQAVPLPSGATGGQLTGLSCSASASCTAVGYANNGSVQAWSWDGAAWSVQPVLLPAGAKSGNLYGVSCASAANCIAVGEYFSSSDLELTLAEHWDGSAWSVLATPNPAVATGSALTAVSCASAARCTAVGDFATRRTGAQLLAEHWNGSTWSVQPAPLPAGATHSVLDGVSCRPVSSCTAVGWYTDNANTEQTLAEHWDGTSWTIQATVGTPDAALGSVSCASATSCTAVGGSGTGALAEHWNGSTWSAQTVPAPAGNVASLTGVSCATASSCTLVGQYRTTAGPVRALAERWNGSGWTLQHPARPNTHQVLNAVSCVASRACTAVGYSTVVGSSAQLPLAEGE